MRDVLDGAREGILRADADLTVERANDAAADLLDTTRAHLEGRRLRAVFPESAGPGVDRLPDDSPPAEPITFEEYYPTHEAWFSIRAVPLHDGLAVYVEDVTRERDRKAQLQRREQKLDTLDRINRVVGDVVAAIAAETDRQEIERTVCDRLAASSLFTCTWIAEPTPGSDRLRERASAGPTEEVLGDLVDGDDRPRGIEARAAREDDIVATQRLPDEESVPESVRKAAFAAGIQSAIAVPISYGDTVYGVLGVYAERADAFGDRERTGFGSLGEITGVAINAAKQRRLLLSDTITELSVRTTAEADPLAAMTADHACELAGAGVVPVDDAALVVFLVVEAGDPEAVLAGGTGEGGIAGDGRIVDDEADDALVSLRIEGECPLSTIVALGGTVREFHYANGAGRIAIDVPPAGASDLADALIEEYSGTRIAAKRERERDVETASAFRTDVRDRLTDRQREAITTASMGGYYDWPRKSTAEELAETLDVSSPTFHFHLRAAHRKLVDVLLEDEAAAGRELQLDENAP